jgi:hypothetical protein
MLPMNSGKRSGDCGVERRMFVESQMQLLGEPCRTKPKEALWLIELPSWILEIAVFRLPNAKID